MMRSRSIGVVCLLALLSSCGGGDATAPAAPPVATTPSTCSLRDRQNWAAATLNEWYLFPETLPASLDPSPYSNVADYIDALTATARAQGRDRYFTYLTSIKEEDAYYASGASAGFGFRIAADATGRRVFVTESFEGAPALAAGIDRGDEITAIGTTSSTLRTVSDIISTEGLAGVTNALGPATAGLVRVLTVAGASGTRTVSVAKADYSLTPISSRYGAQVITDGGRKVGYINLRTFISSADPALKTAFDQFRTQGITDFIIDLRYNGGGLITTAQLMGDLLGGNRATSDVFNYTTYRPEKASNNETRKFAPQPESVSPVKIAFIGTGGTASASELVINAFTPYLGANVALIGTNTYGKPVGQVAIDRTACDDRLRVIALALENSAHYGSYYNGLASAVGTSCRADDDLNHPLGDAQEASTRQALDFIGGQSCTAIASSGQTSQSLATGVRQLLSVDRPNTAQREVPGAF